MENTKDLGNDGNIKKVINGKVVTNTNVTPPKGWTTDYEAMGGDVEWGEKGGDVKSLEFSYGPKGQPQPLFMRPDPPGSFPDAFTVLQLNNQYYLFHHLTGYTQLIASPTVLTEIVQEIDEHGIDGLELEQIVEVRRSPKPGNFENCDNEYVKGVREAIALIQAGERNMRDASGDFQAP